MTVGELILELQGYNPDSEILMSDNVVITGVDSYTSVKTDSSGQKYQETVVFISDSPEYSSNNQG